MCIVLLTEGVSKTQTRDRPNPRPQTDDGTPARSSERASRQKRMQNSQWGVWERCRSEVEKRKGDGLIGVTEEGEKARRHTDRDQQTLHSPKLHCTLQVPSNTKRVYNQPISRFSLDERQIPNYTIAHHPDAMRNAFFTTTIWL